MNKCEEELRNKWNSINYRCGGTLQLSVNHPLEWHVGYFTPEQKSIILLYDVPVNKVESSKSISFSCSQRKDGTYAVCFTLTAREQEDVFITMWGDIIEYSLDGANAKNSMQKVLQRYAAWLKLLDSKKNALLTSNEQKGLIGELLYLKYVIESGTDVHKALDGWVGPDGADQDFVYSDGWHEVKSVGLSAEEVKISSVEQLDSTEDGELVLMRIDKCAPEKSEAFTLFELVHQILKMMQSVPDSMNEFVLKLGSCGYIDMKEYDETHFAFFAKKEYSVVKGFPRLTRANIPTEVNNAEYKLAIAALTPWLK